MTLPKPNFNLCIAYGRTGVPSFFRNCVQFNCTSGSGYLAANFSLWSCPGRGFVYVHITVFHIRTARNDFLQDFGKKLCVVPEIKQNTSNLANTF